MKKTKPKTIFRILAIILLIICFVFSAVLLIKPLFASKNKNQDIKYLYKISNDLNYKVNIFENSFIEQDFMGMDEMYISNLIKNIEVTFNYNFAGPTNQDIVYNYAINAMVVGQYKDLTSDDQSDVWTKKYVLLAPQTEIVPHQAQNNIRKSITIDYNQYNDEAFNFRKELNLPITSFLRVEFVVNTVIKDLEINKMSTMSINIPLQEQAFKIDKNYEKTESDVVFNIDTEEKANNLVTEIVGAILLALTVLVFGLIYKYIFNIKVKTAYEIFRDKVLKEYGDIIIEISKPVSRNNMDVIFVKNFNELIDLEVELHIPIMFYETKKHDEGYFTITSNKTLYLYIEK